jgi:endonuclease G
MRRLGGPRPGLEAAAMAEGGPRVSPPASFAGRPGYVAEFLGHFHVPLPSPRSERRNDVLEISAGRIRLDYEHFSVVMSRSRKMAMFTAVNIRGADYFKVNRDHDVWSYDGRIPLDAQLGEELYAGNDLDRGHLVRREDPNWGGEAEAELANQDTFHFTNCSPQMHRMNSVTWLGLENYILVNAKAWEARVSVFTGPVFGAHDLTYRGVQIPLAYWKVVAFLNDDGKPSATAYMVDQEHELSSLEAAYGRFKTYQRSVQHIEQLTGLDFGPLAGYDGFTNEERRQGAQAMGVLREELRRLEDIRV